MNKLNINTLTASLKQFDQAVEQSAQNFNNIFITKLAGLSNVFQKTVDKVNSSLGIAMSDISDKASYSAATIEAAFADMATTNIDIFDMKAQTLTEKLNDLSEVAKELNYKMSESFAYSAEKIKESMQSIQEYGSYEFTFLSENAINSFKYAKEHIFTGLAELKGKLSETSSDMKEVLKSDFEDTTKAFSASMYLMASTSRERFENIKNTGISSAERIRSSFAGALGSINTNMATTQAAIDASCNRIRNTFSITAKSANADFFKSITGINRKIGEFESKCTDANERAGSAFNAVSNTIDTVLGVVSKVNTGLSIYTNIVSMMNALQTTAAAKTAALAAAKKKHAGSAAAAAIATAAKKSALTKGLAAVPIAVGVAATAAAIGRATGRFATGGFPETGQMFLAREAGPELVGQIGSRNAVVNNDQIVESVSSGVYMAVREAIKNNSVGGKNAPTEVKLYLDGKQITAAVERHQRERGLNLMGGFVYGV